jgi:hypothetical protein
VKILLGIKKTGIEEMQRNGVKDYGDSTWNSPSRWGKW